MTLCFGVGLWRGVTEEVDVVGLAGLACQRLQLFSQCFRAEHGAGQRAQPSRIGHCHSQFMPLHTGHRRLDDG